MRRLDPFAVRPVILLVLLGAAALGASALGPVDGTGLPATDLSRVTVGAPAPDFTLEDETGAPVTLSSFRGQQAIVLVFYRGHW